LPGTDTEPQEERDLPDEPIEIVRKRHAVGPGGLEATWTAGVGPEPEEGPAVEDLDHADREPRILVAQADSRLGRLIVEELPDCRVTLGRDCDEVLELAEEMELDAIVVDVDLQPRGGIEVCRRLRQLKGLIDVPIAITTVRTNEASMSDAMEAGAHEFLFKPYSWTEWRIRIRNMVQSHRYMRELKGKNRTLNAALADLCQSEAMLVQAEKLSVLGEMSAGIVHEINNPLNYCKTASHLLGQSLDDVGEDMREEFADLVNDINEGLDRVASIVKDLRSFASKGTREVTELDLSALVRTARRLLGGRLNNVRYLEDVPGHLRITGNENQLCQVVLNLIKNGVEATEMVERPIDQAELRIRARETGSAVELMIRDNGCGIPEADQERIFEPFFSKKGHGKGMGLGLSICSRILVDHGAEIRVASRLGEFTEFTLSFPLVAPSDPAADSPVSTTT
jgi:C4-dicarboxylate-specific signal transduction histidine kinase